MSKGVCPFCKADAKGVDAGTAATFTPGQAKAAVAAVYGDLS